MDDRRARKPAETFTSWFNPESIAYALVGLLVVGLGARALGRWAVASWADGERTLPALIVSACSITIVALLVFLRGRKRMLYLASALILVGVVSFTLATFGFSLPRSWLE